MCLNSKIQVKDRSKEFLGDKNIINKKKISCKSHRSQWSLHDKYERSKAKECAVIDRWVGLICSAGLIQVLGFIYIFLEVNVYTVLQQAQLMMDLYSDALRESVPFAQ